MKKISLALVCIALIVCAACETQNEPTTLATSYVDEVTAEFVPETSLREDELFVYPPEEIIVSGEPESFDCIYDNDLEPIYRFCYYVFPNELYDMYLNQADADWHTRPSNDYMTAVEFIRQFSIPKENFVKAMRKFGDNNIDLRKCGNMFETWEVLNPDIIYTFDNEIINAYYRRENPVVPEEYRTYDSYEEYLKANPE